ncbi:TrkH family potassium uptake protein [Geoglobus acetivorans]|uniref:Potassium uptake protein TrkH n=1 Tax=Geoglobus acetivorans TaxID=565033 RepID=A0A0A7GFJ3_GEOAI|nr:Potassium uptake protein TrkH [Geoglobus acetivorans]
MNTKLVVNYLGQISIYYSFIFILPLISAHIYGEDLSAFIIPMVISMALGIVFYVSSRPESEYAKYKEGYAIVGLGWLITVLVGSIPYIYYGVGFIDAFFETMSGFTTTGATIFDRVENLPRSLLLWRSLTQWLGGMGIVVLFVAIFPALSKKGETLLQAEVPGLKIEKIRPRMRDTALRLYATYMILTVLEIVFLKLLGVSFFDAVNHTFTTLSTGGFSTHTESVAYFNSPAIEFIIFVFMVLGGSNFVLIYLLLTGKPKFLRDVEFRFYIFILILSGIILTAMNLSSYDLLESIRYSFFQVASIMTTTGYTTADFDAWGDSAKILILMLMFIGGSTGSTGGGIKVIRIYLLSLYSLNQILKSAEPRSVRLIKLNGEVVDWDILHNITAFFSLYVLIFVFSTFLVSLTGLDAISSISAVSATINNVGPGLGAVGATESYASLHPLAKVVLAFNMWIGRLELFTVLSLFIPSFWRERW